MSDEITRFIGEVVVYGGGAAAVAYALFVFLGKNWIENQFAKGLQKYRHRQNEELEEIRYKINTLFDKVTKVHEKEFQVLPEAWGKLTDAINHVHKFVSAFQQHPDINKMSTAELNEFLRDSILYEYQKNELMQAKDKTEYYQEKKFFHDLVAVRNIYSDFHVYMQKNIIFLREELKVKFDKIDDLMWDALIRREIANETDDRKEWVKASQSMRDEVSPLKDEIAEIVHKELHKISLDS